MPEAPATRNKPRKSRQVAGDGRAHVVEVAGDGRVRAVVDAVLPAVDCGRFPIKRVIGDSFEVTAHCFTDGHDVLRVMLCWQSEHDTEASEVGMKPHGNDV
jgi:starch synthase (maltosyl-transferring)